MVQVIRESVNYGPTLAVSTMSMTCAAASSSSVAIKKINRPVDDATQLLNRLRLRSIAPTRHLTAREIRGFHDHVHGLSRESADPSPGRTRH